MRITILTVLMVMGVSLGLFAQDSNNVKEKEFGDWQFRVGPYYWFIGIDASIERPPVPSTLPEPDSKFDISIPYNEIHNSLKFAFLINTDYHNNRWLGVLNATSFILEGDAITPKEIIIKDSQYRLAVAFGEALVGYEIVSKRKFKFQGLIGSKIIYNKITANGTYGIKKEFFGEREGFWVEPVLAVKLKYFPHPRIECSGYLDYGPIRSEHELTNQLSLNVNFLLTKWLYIAPGYRYWLFRVDRDEAIFNGQMYGFYVRVGAQF